MSAESRELERACRDLAEEATCIDPLSYATRIARAGCKIDPTLGFLGPVRPAVVASLAAFELLLQTRSRHDESRALPLREKLRHFLTLLEGVAPPGEEDFAVETAGAIGSLELRSRLDAAVGPELMEILRDKAPLLPKIQAEAAKDGPARLLLKSSEARTTARIIHYLSPHAWGPFVTVDIHEASREARQEAFTLLDWLPASSTVFLPRLPPGFEIALSRKELPAQLRLESRGRVLAVSRNLHRLPETDPRLADWSIFPFSAEHEPVISALMRVIDSLRGEPPAARDPYPGPRPAHRYWMEHHGEEKLGFCRLALAESQRSIERDPAARRGLPGRMLEILSDARLSAIDEDRAGQLRALALLQRVESRFLQGDLADAPADLPEVEWLSQKTRDGGSPLWRLEIETGCLAMRGRLEARRRRGSDLPPPADLARATGQLRQSLRLQEARGEAPHALARGRLCELLLLEGSAALGSGLHDMAAVMFREALGRLPETGSDELRFVATLHLGLCEFLQNRVDQAWARVETLEQLAEDSTPRFAEPWRRWLLGHLHLDTLERVGTF